MTSLHELENNIFSDFGCFGHSKSKSAEELKEQVEDEKDSTDRKATIFSCTCAKYELTHYPMSVCCEVHHDMYAINSMKYIKNQLQPLCEMELKKLLTQENVVENLQDLSSRLLFNGMTLAEVCVILIRYDQQRLQWERDVSTREINVGFVDKDSQVLNQTHSAINKWIYRKLTSIVNDVLNIHERKRNSTHDKTFKANFVRLLKQEEKHARQFKKSGLVVKNKPNYRYKSKKKKPELFFSSVWIQPISDYIRQCGLLSGLLNDFCPPYKKHMIFQKCFKFMHDFQTSYILAKNKS